MFNHLLNGFKIITLHNRVEATNFIGSYLTHLKLSSCVLLINKCVSYLQYGQAFVNLFTLTLNTICFVIVNTNYNILSFDNLFHCYLRAVFTAREADSSPFSAFSPKCSSITGAASDRFVRFPTVILCTPITRVPTLSEIRIALIIAGIENNPGPEQTDEPNTISNLEIITINCNGLTCNVRLLQTISKLKKCLKKKDCIVFFQETHNANIILLESIWEGSVHVLPGTGGSKGVIILCSPNLFFFAHICTPS